MNRDKIVDEHLKGKSVLSAVYHKASEGDRCPDDLAARILAEAAHGTRAKAAGGIVEGLRRRFRRSYDRHPIWTGTILPMVLAAVLVLGFQLIIGAGTQTDLECRGTLAGQSSDRSISTPAP